MIQPTRHKVALLGFALIACVVSISGISVAQKLMFVLFAISAALLFNAGYKRVRGSILETTLLFFATAVIASGIVVPLMRKVSVFGYHPTFAVLPNVALYLATLLVVSVLVFADDTRSKFRRAGRVVLYGAISLTFLSFSFGIVGHRSDEAPLALPALEDGTELAQLEDNVFTIRDGDHSASFRLADEIGRRGGGIGSRRAVPLVLDFEGDDKGVYTIRYEDQTIFVTCGLGAFSFLPRPRSGPIKEKQITLCLHETCYAPERGEALRPETTPGENAQRAKINEEQEESARYFGKDRAMFRNRAARVTSEAINPKGKTRKKEEIVF